MLEKFSDVDLLWFLSIDFLVILSFGVVFCVEVVLFKVDFDVPTEFWFPTKFIRSSCSLLLVIGLSSFPWFDNDKVPVSSETTIQIHLSNLSVIPNAAKCLVPYLLIPCLERGNITPAEIILLPFTKTAPSWSGVSVANKLINKSVDNCASILVPEYKKLLEMQKD